MGDVPGDSERFAGVADVVRYWDESLPLVYTIDDSAAMIGEAEIVASGHSSEAAVTVSERQLSGSILGMCFSTCWPAATELYVTEPGPLPRTYDWFWQATLNAILHLQAGVDLYADIETDDGTLLSGPVTEVRQAFVEPATNDSTLENSFMVDTDEGIVSVGGSGSFIEDDEAETVRLRERSAVQE